ncbi:MAG TPA: hypothetical protein VN285_05870 [Candidatus Deferrimicrobium sp.]|nr:hypothetical protein [Candidatus Deferrimicrobium sp.]
MTVGACLFDAQLRRGGKPTSFRLEVLHNDSVAVLAGRAYLGKGALRGRLTRDSLSLYIPSTHEYVDESLQNLLKSAECSAAEMSLDFLSLLTTLPDAQHHTTGIDVLPDYSDAGRPTFVVTSAGCLWKLELTYDHSDSGWRLRELFFTGSKDVSLNAKRRQCKPAINVSADKLRFAVPDGAARVIP